MMNYWDTETDEGTANIHLANVLHVLLFKTQNNFNKEFMVCIYSQMHFEYVSYHQEYITVQKYKYPLTFYVVFEF